ncbi:2398_t:CDS:2 [Entrophospora sp. SA101]|nr:2398_t:CDS:2 [Entrophospora sp. SA101]
MENWEHFVATACGLSVGLGPGDGDMDLFGGFRQHLSIVNIDDYAHIQHCVDELNALSVLWGFLCQPACKIRNKKSHNPWEWN